MSADCMQGAPQASRAVMASGEDPREGASRSAKPEPLALKVPQPYLRDKRTAKPAHEPQQPASPVSQEPSGSTDRPAELHRRERPKLKLTTRRTAKRESSPPDKTSPAGSPVLKPKPTNPLGKYGHASMPRERRAPESPTGKLGRTDEFISFYSQGSLDDFISSQPEYLNSPLGKLHPEPAAPAVRPVRHPHDSIPGSRASRSRIHRSATISRTDNRRAHRRLELPDDDHEAMLKLKARARVPAGLTARAGLHSRIRSTVERGRAELSTEPESNHERPSALPVVSEGEEEPATDENKQETAPAKRRSGQREGGGSVRGHRIRERLAARRGEALLELVRSGKELPVLFQTEGSRSCSVEKGRDRALSDGWLAHRPARELPPIIPAAREGWAASGRSDGFKCPLCGELVLLAGESEAEQAERLRMHIQSECHAQAALPPDAAQRQPELFGARVSALVKLLMAAEPGLQLRAAGELAGMAGQPDPARTLMVVEESVILPLVYCCRTSGTKVRVEALLALARLSELPEGRLRVARCLSFSTLHRMLEETSAPQELRLAAAELLNWLLLQDDGIRVKLAREGGAELLLRLHGPAPHPARLSMLVAGGLVSISELPVPQSCDSLAALGPRLLQLLEQLAAGGELHSAGLVMRNVCCNDEHRHVPSFRQDCVPLVAMVLANKAAGPETKCLGLECLNSLTGYALRSVDGWAEQRKLVCLVVLCATDKHKGVAELAWPLLVVITAGPVVAGKAVEAGVVPAVLEVLVHDRAGLDRESMVMAVTCLANLASQPGLRSAVIPVIPALRPLALGGCSVSAEVAGLLDGFSSSERFEQQPAVEADLDIMSLMGDEPGESSSGSSAPGPSLAQLAPRSEWELSLGQLEFKNLVGAGSYAEVYSGRLAEREVAIKRFRTKHMSAVEHRQFLNEVHMLAALEHTNVLGFVGAVAVEPHFCIVTEFVSPGSLQVPAVAFRH